MTRLNHVVLGCLLSCVTWLGMVQAAPQAKPVTPPAAPVVPPAATPADAYAGSEACGICHEDISKALLKSPHGVVEKAKGAKDSRRGWSGNACESCHGPGAKHAESASPDDIRNPKKLAAAAADKVCLTCHLNEPTHVGRLQSSHAKDQVPCTTCHSMHSGHLVERQAEAVNQQCSGCHANVAAQFQKPSHHKVPENAMKCVDCHNPHGSIQRVGMTSMMQSFGANEPGCLACHGDKRGPFTFEHAPVRFEGCATCHEPHGSANPRMLIRAEVRQMCLECHANLPTVPSRVAGVVPPSFHDLRSARYRNCTVCHQKIHGSHVDRNLLK
jgi:DmsE family decaheme c-type cytochrome